MPPGKPKSAMKPAPAMEPSTSDLVRIVTDLSEATKSLPPAEREAYEDAQRSVVEARFLAEKHEDHVRVL